MSNRYDVIIVGGGHAGCEAAAAAARMGVSVALVTMRRDRIGEMSCNPAIGGLGKGHLVREIDALDGIMARAIDRAGIQFRMLNKSRGPAVHGPRAQADRALYRHAIQDILADYKNLTIVEAAVGDLQIEAGRITGLITENGDHYLARAVVLTTGTFLGGVIHLGDERTAAGRIGEAPSNALATRLAAFDLPLGRLKTGTPARLDGRTIDWSGLICNRPTIRQFPFLLLQIGSPSRKSPAVSPVQRQRRIKLSQNQFICLRFIAGSVLVQARVIALRSRIKCIALPISHRTRFFLNPKGWMIQRFIQMAFQPRCRAMCKMG